jgi:alpha-1,2-mannosyltransferase
MRGYSATFLALYLLTSVVWIALAHGLVDLNNKPIGTDFSNVYAAGTLALDGKPALAYDWPSEHAIENSTFARDVPFYGWHYPPPFLMVAAVLALVPYGWALALWMGVTLSAYVGMIRAILPQPTAILVALAFPAVFINICHGQNGFLSAASLGGGLLMLDRRPIVAGVLIGLLAYKPQFGVLIPLALLATTRWKVIAAAAGTVLAEYSATFALFGRKVWAAFAASTSLTDAVEKVVVLVGRWLDYAGED